jgi:hypothetical protein
MNLTMAELQRMVKKYGATRGGLRPVSRSGSRREVARRLITFRAHMMTLSDLKKVENFLLSLPPNKKVR